MSTSQFKDLSDIELKILLTLYKSGGQYVQRNLWKTIGIDGKTGLPHLSKLEKKGYIIRERIGESKRAQYLIKLTNEGKAIIEAYLKAIGKEVKPQIPKLSIETLDKDIPETLKLVMTIPCFYCPYLDICTKVKHLNPETCEFFSKWLVENCKSIS